MVEDYVDMEYISLHGYVKNTLSDAEDLSEHQLRVCKSSWKGIYAAATAKLLQSCPTLCNPIDGSLPGSSVHGTLQARLLEWIAIAFSKRNI